jgi:hypothetical protein
MRSLANLLEAAVGRSAIEVVLESGQPVVFTTARGSEAEQSVLPPTELFDMIVAAVDDAQQIELAVGNPVQFTIQAGASWSVIAEPGIEGMSVRAQRAGGVPSLEIDLDEPGFAIDDDDVDFGGSTGAMTRRAPPSQLDVEALDVPTLHDPDFGRTSVPAPAAPFESGTWTLADEDDLDLGLENPDEGRLPTNFPDLPPSGYEVGGIGVPEDDDDTSPFDPFSEPRRTVAPTLPAVPSIKPPPTTRSPARGRSAQPEKPTVREPSAARAEAQTRRELGALGSPDADTHRELRSVAVTGASLGQLVAQIGEGSLVYVRELGLAESLAQSFAAPSVTIDDQVDADEVWSRIRGLPTGAVVIVRREDPSTILAWILRRIEEGHRVLVESRARTVEGARRILLGVGASERAEQWLDRHEALVIEPGDEGPRVRPATNRS